VRHQRLSFWLWAGRAPFLAASLLSVLLGVAVADARGATVNAGPIALVTMGVALIHLGVNLANDYFDHLRGTDTANRNRTRYNGGSGVIQAGLATPSQIARAALVCILAAGVIGVGLAIVHGPLLWVLMIAGLMLGVGYSAPPLSLMGTGWGELTAGLCCGPLVALGAHHVAGGRALGEVWLAAVPAGLLVSSILVANELPDYEADRMTHKRNLVVRLGVEAGLQLWRALVIAAYCWIGVLVAGGRLPIGGLAALSTAPLAWWWLRQGAGGRHAVAGGEGPGAGANPGPAPGPGTVRLHALVSVLLAVSYLLR